MAPMLRLWVKGSDLRIREVLSALAHDHLWASVDLGHLEPHSFVL